MKKLFFVLTICLITSSCGKELQKNPKSELKRTKEQSEKFDRLKYKPDGEKKKFIREECPFLIEEIIKKTKEEGKNKQISPKEEDIKIIFYSGTGKGSAIDEKGKSHEGKYTKALIAKVEIKGKKESLFLILSNMRVLIPKEKEEKRVVIGELMLGSRIQEGEGIANHIPEMKKWASEAELLKIPIIDEKGNIVKYDTYTTELGKYRTLLQKDDYIDYFRAQVIDSAGRKVDWKQRIQQHEKKQEEAKKKAKKTRRQRR